MVFFSSNYGVGRPETCKTCVSGPETHVYACLRSSPPYFDFKKQIISKVIDFLIKTWWRKTELTFMLVSNLHQPYSDEKKTNLIINWFLIQTWWGKTWDMLKRAFQALKLTFMHVSSLPQPYFDMKKKTISKVIDFLIKTWWRKTWDMHKRPFQALKLTFVHISNLHQPYFDFKKTN